MLLKTLIVFLLLSPFCDHLLKKKVVTEKFTHEGNWFLPDNPNLKIAGTLTFDPNQGSSLALLGVLVNFETSIARTHTPKFILGTTISGKKITLFDSFERHRNSGAEAETYKYRSRFILIGNHFANEAVFLFDEATCSLANLAEQL